MRERPSPPLLGLRIAVTRRPEQAAGLSERLRALGASALEVPTVSLAPPEDPGPLDDALRALHRYDWLVFTSANAVGAFALRMSALGLDQAPVGRALPVASVGASTSEAVFETFPGARIELQPVSDFRAEGLAQALLSRGVAEQRFLLPVSDKAASTLARAIQGGGGRVDSVVAYRTLPPQDLPERVGRLLDEGLDLFTFASPSAVQNLVAAAGSRALSIAAAVIGPVTQAAALKAGFRVVAVAEPSSAEGLVQAIVRHYSGGG